VVVSAIFIFLKNRFVIKTSKVELWFDLGIDLEIGLTPGFL